MESKTGLNYYLELAEEIKSQLKTKMKIIHECDGHFFYPGKEIFQVYPNWETDIPGLARYADVNLWNQLEHVEFFPKDDLWNCEPWNMHNVTTAALAAKIVKDINSKIDPDYIYTAVLQGE